MCYSSYFFASCHISSLTRNFCWIHTLHLAYNEQDLSPETGEKRGFSTDPHRNQTTHTYLQQRSKIQCTCMETITCVFPSPQHTCMHAQTCNALVCGCAQSFCSQSFSSQRDGVKGQFCHSACVAALRGMLNLSLPPSACLIPSCYSNQGYW